MLNNPSLAHLAGPGSQGSLQATGLRLMHRSTVPGRISPTKKTNLDYVCQNHAPFHGGYCLFSLKVLIDLRAILSIYKFNTRSHSKSRKLGKQNSFHLN